MSRPSSPRYRPTGSWCAGLAVLAGLALAAAGQVSLKSVAGPYGRYITPGKWTQRIFVLENHGTASAKMTVACITSDPQAGQMSYARTIDVPPDARRKAHLAYRPGVAKPLRKLTRLDRDRLVNCEQIYTLTDARTGRRIPQKLQTIMRLPEHLTAVSVVGGAAVAGETYSYLKNLPGGELGKVQLIAEQRESLPDRWYGYSMIDILAVGGSDVSQLRATQVEAILQWVSRGGALILTATGELEDMLASRLGLAAGVSAAGMHHTDLLNIDGPGMEGVSVELTRALPFVELAPETAEVVYTAGGLPLLTKKRLGHGHVFTLAAPIASLMDPKCHDIFYQIAQACRLAPPLDEASFLASAKHTLNQIAGRRSLTGIVPVSILLALMGLTVVAGIFLRFAGRGELVWAVLLPVAILVSFGLYAYGRSQSDSQRLSHIGLISGIGDDTARVQEVFAYASGPRTAKVTFTAGNEQGLVEDIGAAAGEALKTGRIETDAVVKLPGRQVKQNATAAVYVDTVAKVGRIATDVTFGADGLVGSITNGLSADVNDAVIYVNGQTYRLGQLKAGQATEVAVGAGDKLAAGEFSGSVVPEPLRNKLLGSLAVGAAARKATVRPVVDRSPVLIGYSPLSPLDPLGGMELDRQGWSVVVWPLDISTPPAGAEVFIPAGFVKLDLKSSMWNPGTGRFSESQRGSVQLWASPPGQVGSLEDATAIVTMNINATGFVLKAHEAQADPTGKLIAREELASYANPTGQVELVIDRAERLADRRGRLALLLTVARLAKGGQRGPVTLADAATFRFESIQIALKGKVR